MAKVFVSYSRKDMEFAKRLTGELQKSDLDFWIDWEGIPPTVDWWREIEKGIEEADIFVFLISPDSAKSKVCGQELDSAIRNGKRLIPLVVRDIKADEAPPQLSHLNWIFFRENDDFDAALQKLLTGIHTDYEWVQQHRWLQVRALDWQRDNKESGSLLRARDLHDAEFQLATNSSKEPRPTDLQREYVFESRKATDRQRRLVTGISIAGVIALAALAVFGFIQAGLATANEQKALSNASTAQAVNTIAVSNEQRAEAASTLAFNNAETAVANEQEAREQAQIALARQWAAEANALLASPNGNAETAALLSLHALKNMYIPAADAALVASLNRLYTTKIFDQHDARVSAVAYSPKGDRIAIGYIDGTAGLFDVNTGEEIQRFDGFAGYYDGDNDPITQGVHAVTFSTTGDLLLVAGSDGHILVWNTSTASTESDFTIQGNLPLWSAKFSPDGRYILAGTGYPHAGPGNIYLFERTSGDLKHTFPSTETQTRYITDVEFSRDGKSVLSTSFNGTAVLWDMDWETLSASPRHTFRSSSPIRDGAFSANGEYVLLGEDSGIAGLYRSDGTPVIKFAGHTDAIFSVNFSPTPGYILTGSVDGTVRLWDTESGKTLRTFVNHKDWVLSTAFSPDGKYVITGSYDKTARLWAASPMHDARTLYGHTAKINLVAFSPDGTSILSSSGDQSVRLWNSKTLEANESLSTSLLDPKAAISAQGNWIAASTGVYQGTEFNIVFWEKTGSGYRQVDFPVDPMFSAVRVESLAFSNQTAGKESEYLLVGLEDGTLGLLQNLDGTWGVVKWSYGPSFPTDVAFTTDLKFIASTSEKHDVVYAQIPIYRLEADGTVFADCASALASDSAYGSSAIAFSPDANQLVTESGKDILLLDWGPDSPDNLPHACTIVKRLSGHAATVTDLTFSPDGNHLLSASLDGTAILWDTESWQPKRVLSGHDGAITSASFSSDGKFIVTGGADKTIRVWDVDYQNTIDTVCSLLERFNRDLTPQERVKYQIADDQPTCE